MSGITPGHGILCVGVIVGFIAADPVFATFDINRLSTAPLEVQGVAYSSVASAFLATAYAARRVD